MSLYDINQQLPQRPCRCPQCNPPATYCVECNCRRDDLDEDGQCPDCAPRELPWNELADMTTHLPLQRPAARYRRYE
jgi:hypothetical protein